GYSVPESATALCWALPAAEITNFQAQSVSKKVQLSWKISEPRLIEGYEIQKTVDQSRYTTVQKIAGSLRNYFQVFDEETPRVVTYYRLKIIKKDGTIIYSKLIPVQAIKEKGLTYIGVHPSPARSKITLDFFIEKTTTATIHIINTSGTTIFKSIYDLHEGYANIEVPVNNFRSGLYFLFIQADSQRLVSKFVKNQ
ncbi:MAG TPA: T9SS type A sorting domain-containing protein, partial [Flavitalea sp.]|nr:T9SS type A sorting domain-containing protein [Flavitalea sp.]